MITQFQLQKTFRLGVWSHFILDGSCGGSQVSKSGSEHQGLPALAKALVFKCRQIRHFGTQSSKGLRNSTEEGSNNGLWLLSYSMGLGKHPFKPKFLQWIVRKQEPWVLCIHLHFGLHRTLTGLVHFQENKGFMLSHTHCLNHFVNRECFCTATVYVGLPPASTIPPVPLQACSFSEILLFSFYKNSIWKWGQERSRDSQL